MGLGSMVMELSELTQDIRGLAKWSHAKKIVLFGWHLHRNKGRDRFKQPDIRACYDALHLDKPSDVSPYLHRLATKKNKELLRDSRGYYLSSAARKGLDSRFEQKAASVKIRKILSDLAGKLSDEAESKFLSEAIVCFQSGAFRAAIVMTWNLAFFHFATWIFDNHLAAFNAAVSKRYPKNKDQVGKLDDFSDLFKEYQVIEIARTAGFITGNTKKILHEKLVKRNMAAHPSSVEITQVQAEEVIVDLVSNVMLKMV